MTYLNHNKHLEYCRLYYIKNRERLKEKALNNYYNKTKKSTSQHLNHQNK